MIFEIKLQDKYSRLELLLRSFFDWFYIAIPHGFVLFFRAIATFILQSIAFWIVLFTGEFPKMIHEFITGTLRWNQRVALYISYMTDEYPPFTGKRLENEFGHEF